jgi:hypothetical protein
LTISGSFASAVDATLLAPLQVIPHLSVVVWRPDDGLLAAVNGMEAKAEASKTWRDTFRIVASLPAPRMLIRGPPTILHAAFSDTEFLATLQGKTLTLCIDQPGSFVTAYSEPFYDAAQLGPTQPMTLKTVLAPECQQSATPSNLTISHRS